MGAWGCLSYHVASNVGRRSCKEQTEFNFQAVDILIGADRLLCVERIFMFME